LKTCERRVEFLIMSRIIVCHTTSWELWCTQYLNGLLRKEKNKPCPVASRYHVGSLEGHLRQADSYPLFPKCPSYVHSSLLPVHENPSPSAEAKGGRSMSHEYHHLQLACRFGDPGWAMNLRIHQGAVIVDRHWRSYHPPRHPRRSLPPSASCRQSDLYLLEHHAGLLALSSAFYYARSSSKREIISAAVPPRVVAPTHVSPLQFPRAAAHYLQQELQLVHIRVRTHIPS
jgi:hypothetical protein